MPIPAEIPKLNEMMEIFVDRNSEIKLFHDKYNKVNKNNYEVINYHGIPGIGKSNLLHRLEDSLIKKGRQKDYIRLDFNENVLESYEYLELLAERLSINNNFSFPIFAYALSYYYQRVKGVINSDSYSFNQLFKEKHSALHKLIQPVLAATAAIPVVGVWSGLVLTGYQVYDTDVNNWILNNKNTFEKINISSLEILEKQLPLYFATDLKNNIEKYEYPFVIFLDTYEFYRNANIQKKENFDSWLWDEKYGIINHIPNILWIISGREVLECKIKSNHWKDNIFDVELKDFDKIEQDEKIDYARFFLDKTPIVENNIKNTIKEVSGGLPFHLHLCVEYYMELKGNGEKPKEEDFQKNFTELLEKFVKYLDAEEKNLIYLLVCIGRWKRRDLYDRKYKKYFEKFYAIIDNVLGLSFVICDGEEYYFHQKAYDILKRNSPEYVKIICQEYMDKKYELNDISERERLTFIQNRIIDEVSQIGNNNLIENVDRLINSFENNSIYLKEFIIERKYMAFEQIYKPYYKLINHCNISNKKVAEVVVNIYAIYTQYLEQREDHKRAFNNQSKVIEIVEEYLKDNIDLYLNERYQMLSIQLFLKKDKNWFIELTNLKEDCEKKLKSDSELTKGVTRLWNYYAMISNLQYDIDTVEQFAEEEIRQYGVNSSRGIKIQMDLAYTYKLHGQYDKAIEIGEKVVSEMKNIFGEGDRDYINAMDNLAIAYRKRGEELQKKGVLNENNEDFKKMIKYGLEVYRLGKRYVNKDTVDYASYLYQVIICHVYQNKFIEAKDYCIEALNLKLFKEMDYPYKACVYDTIARAYNDEGNLRKGAYYINKYYELACVNLGANSKLAYSLKQTRDLLRMNIKK